MFFSIVGTAILGQLGLIFIGVAIGMAKRTMGRLAGALGYAMVTKVLNPENVATLFNIKEKQLT